MADVCVLSESKTVVTLSQPPLGAGGEGSVHLLPDKKRVAKKFHNPTDLHQRKLSYMVAHPLARASLWSARDVAWPEELLLDRGTGKFVGYVTSFFEGYVSLIDMLNVAERQKTFPGWTYAHSVNTAANLAKAAARLHASGIVLGDVSPANVLVSATTTVGLIDVDSYQVSVGGKLLTCLVATPDTTPPEVQNIPDLSKLERMWFHDTFGISALAFQLLSDGYHPYSGRVELPKGVKILPPTVPERISQNLWYASKSKGIGKPKLTAPPGALPFDTFSKAVQNDFLEAFDGGSSRPERRPSASKLEASLRMFGRELIYCKANPRHAYLSGLKACPHCDRIARIGIDIYALGPAP